MEKYLAGAFGLLIGIAGIWLFFTQLRNFKELSGWKTIGGKVIESGTIDTGYQRNKYSPLVKYKYDVDGREFVNDAIFPKHLQGSPRGDSEWAKNYANSFPNEPTVFYNPQNPNDSFLKFPSKTLFYIIGMISLIVILYSFFIMVFGVDHWVGRFK